MKAMMLKEYHQPMELVDVETPQINDDEVLVQVRSCGICQTDLKIFKGEIPPPIVVLPHIPGHEIAGIVKAVGKNVSGIAAGDAGIVYIYIACHACDWCMSGRENLCPNLKRVGFELPGGYAQYVRVPSYAFCPFDPRLSFNEMAVLPDAIATAYRAVTVLGNVRPGQNILIVGAGGLGIHAVQIAKLCGARVLVADRKKKALQLAEEFGADVLIDADTSPLERIRDASRGKGVDAVIEIVGSKETLAWSLPSLKKGGKLIIVGYVPGQAFPLETMAMHYNEWEIKGARLSTKAELLQVIHLVEQGKIKPVVSKTFPFEKANEALKALSEETTTGRLVLTF
ncbi:MAG: alcohol dehydrogenase catalytic domain-containing protein [Deltaproteobacteria bacterium]